MYEDLRGFISRLREEGQLEVVSESLDARYVSALANSTSKAVLFERVNGYEIPVVAGVCRDRDKVALALNERPANLVERLSRGLESRIEPVEVDSAPCQEVVITGENVDLTDFPIIFQHEKDGGPYISSGIQFAVDPELGPNAGVYRQMLRTRNTTGIDLNSPSDLRLYYERALQRGSSLPMAVAIGNHPIELLAATHSAPTGQFEMGLAGALRGEPVKMVRCKTIDVCVPADSEVVLECEILPTGWTADEGRYGEFHRVAGTLKWNPIVKVNAITHRRHPLWYTLVMPWEVYGLAGPLLETRIWSLLKSIGVRPAAVRATVGGCCFFDVVVSLHNARPGEGKAAVLAVMSLMGIKTVTVVDDDINIFDDDELRWALSLRMQPAEDVIIATNCQAKHMDPTVKTWTLPKGQLPVTSKMGIDATLPPDIDRRHYERLEYAFSREVRDQARHLASGQSHSI